MSILMQDLRYAVRMLYKNRSFTIVALIVLTLGIGANSAIFSFVNGILLRSLPYSNPERLVRIYSTSPGKEIRTFTSSYPDFLDWKNNNQVFEEMGAWARASATLTGTDNPERFDTALVTPGFFNVLGVTPARGRVFTAEDDKAGSNAVVVLSNGVWRGRFGSDPNITGKPLTLEGTTYTIIGVMPADFNFLFSVDVWMPLSLTGQTSLEDRGKHFLSVLARLKPGVSLRQAQLDLQNIAARIEKEYAKTNQGWGNNAVLLYNELTGGIRGPLWVLFAAALLVLMIACLNVANLQLIRAASRSKEMAMRMAIGATRGRLIRQLLTESVVLAVIGGLLGLLLAIGGISLLKSSMPATRIPRLNEVGLDGFVVLFTLGISLLTGVIFGLSPAFRALRPDINETLKEGGRSNSGGTGNRLRSLLVVSEIALALMLTVFAGLVIQTFKNLVNIDPGFKTENVVTMQMSLPPSRYQGPPQIKDFYQRVLENIKAQPGVVAAGATNNLPLTGGGGYSKIYVEGQENTKPKEMMTGFQIATPEYFRAMGVPFLAGRDFTPQEDLVSIVNDSTAKKLWPGENPLGKRVKFSPIGEWITVVGVVADMKALGLTAEPRMEMFLTLGQDTFRSGFVIVRSNAGTETMVPSLRAAVLAIDKNMAIFNIKTMEKVVSDSIAQPRFNMVLLAIFAGLALILASVGIYGVMSYSVTQRTQELGVRMALGAQRRDIFSLVLKQGIILALIGVAIGLAGAIGLSKALSSVLYGISATDPVTFISVAVIMIAVALIACFFPARKATKVDPLTAMRYE
jgi:putative ABC transport system permease protein